ncbi:MAG TPA: phosphate ABC transporter substrate-binding protein PstS [Micromonosporaceae bacterium]|nr:phosphate ABC transporter substrate-binding protein PstS [Micromonosporaceae bacterium]
MSATGTGDGRASRAPTSALTAGRLMLAVALVLSGCGTGNIPMGQPAVPAGSAPADGRCVTGSLKAEGSSAQKIAMDRWRALYQQKCPAATVGYQATSSVEGIKTLIDGKADFVGSDIPLSEEEQRSADKRCGAGPAIHLPMAVGQIALAYRVPGLFNLRLGPVGLAKIFSGSATRWDDAAIRADNPAAALPPTPIRTVHRSDSSGTTDNFTTFLAAAAPGDWTFGRGRDWKAPGGTGAMGTSGVTRAVRDGEGTIGYVELSAAQKAALSVAGIDSGAGDYVQPTSEGAERAIKASKIESEGNDVRLEIDYAGRKPAAYPVVLVTYEIVCQKGLEPGKAALARSFLSYTAGLLGQRELPGLGYASLPDPVRQRVEFAVASIA